MEAQLPELFPGWKTMRMLGTGSYGSVYEISRDLFGRTERAALKVISTPQTPGELDELYSSGFDRDSIAEYYKGHLTQIVQEYSIMAEVKGHSNIVCCDDVIITHQASGIGWTILIRMELLSPLLQSMDHVGSTDQVVKLGMDICQALIICHNKGIVHRDIKPQNIFMSHEGNFKLGDFGVAKIMDRTMGGTKVGTFSYMAPEVYNCRPYGICADIYSLGLVMYWLLNDRRLPFLSPPPHLPTVEENELARIKRFDGHKLPPPRRGSKALAQVILKACAYDPDDRYKTPQELMDALRDASAKADAPQISIAEKVSVWRSSRFCYRGSNNDRRRDDGPSGTVTLLSPPSPPADTLMVRPCSNTASVPAPNGSSTTDIETICVSQKHIEKPDPPTTGNEAHPAERSRPKHLRTLILLIAVLLSMSIVAIVAPHFFDSRPAPQTSDPTVDHSKEKNDAIPADALQYGGHSYYLYDDDTILSWEEAHLFCESKGGYLAVIGSEEENNVLFDHISSLGYGQVFFGYSDRIEEDTWIWVPQEASDFTNWHVGQPNDRHASDYAQFLHPYKGGPATVWGGWSDAEWGGSNGYAFLCEWPTSLDQSHE